jgi:hypothetical protein
MRSTKANSVFAAATIAVSAIMLTMLAMADTRPAKTLCRDVVPGSIVEVMNCPQASATPQLARAAPPHQPISLAFRSER